MKTFWFLFFVSLSAGAQRYDVTHSVKDSQGGIYRADTIKKVIYLVFTAHEFADGASTIISTLERNQVQASFFFTGAFYRTFTSITQQLKQRGHYLGAHSDQHLLYCDWTKRDSMLVSDSEIVRDLRANYDEMKKLGVSKKQALFIVPPFEWYNQHVVSLLKKEGLTVVNFSPGTSSNADYTTPDMKNYLTSDEILERIYKYDQKKPSGLNGFHLLIHFGTDPLRKDKLYAKLDDIIRNLKQRGYVFKRFN